MRHWNWVSLLLCISVVGFSFGVLPAYGQIKLNYSNFFPAPHKMAVLSVEWGKEIEKRTNGRVQVTVFPGGTLTPAAQCYDGVVKGISDLGLSVLGYTRGKFPLLEVIDLPLGYKNAYVATKLANINFKKFQPKELGEVKLMYLHAHGPGILHTKKAVEKLEDLKGMKIVCHGLSSKIVAALGGVPVAMPMPERYDALQKGVADGAVHPIEANKGWKMAEVTKFTTLDYGAAYTSTFFVVMNKEKWNSLPPDIQKIIEQVNEEWIEKTGRGWDEIEAEGREVTLARGNKIISLSKAENERWAKRVKPVIDDYVKSMKEKGLPGKESLKFCREELKKL
jgi:TRAP-type C4-dicarboxylate transport system substrate-binding protein